VVRWASTFGETRLRRVRDAQPEGAALVIDGDADTGNKKTLTQSGGAWFGFGDFSDQLNVSEQRPTAGSPHRIMFVKEGCW